MLKHNTVKIIKKTAGSGRKHPCYCFFNSRGSYICEVRYGGAAANALQRGLWTHTQKGANYFDSLTNGWLDYSHNPLLVDLFSKALVASPQGHREALKKIVEDIRHLQVRKGGN